MASPADTANDPFVLAKLPIENTVKWYKYVRACYYASTAVSSGALKLAHCN